METSGIIRRIDELGRIVIPKEIRKTLRVRNGDNLEILINNNDEIILKKFSVMKNLGDFAQKFTDAIYSFVKYNIIITDTTNVIAVSGPLKKEYLNKDISEDRDLIIKRRDSMLEKHFKNISIINDKEELGSYTYCPILVNGDVAGIVLIVSNEEKLTTTEERIASIASSFLAKYLEE